MYSRLAGGFLKLGIPYFVVLSFFSVVDIFDGPSKSSSFFTVISHCDAFSHMAER